MAYPDEPRRPSGLVSHMDPEGFNHDFVSAYAPVVGDALDPLGHVIRYLHVRIGHVQVVVGASRGVACRQLQATIGNRVARRALAPYLA